MNISLMSFNLSESVTMHWNSPKGSRAHVYQDTLALELEDNISFEVIIDVPCSLHRRHEISIEPCPERRRFSGSSIFSSPCINV